MTELLAILSNSYVTCIVTIYILMILSFVFSNQRRRAKAQLIVQAHANRIIYTLQLERSIKPIAMWFNMVVSFACVGPINGALFEDIILHSPL
jgi:ascorbate-specific PTS system EIIC-type component UlaA